MEGESVRQVVRVNCGCEGEEGGPHHDTLFIAKVEDGVHVTWAKGDP
jgi:hypothetical protein